MRASLHYLDGGHEFFEHGWLGGAFLVFPEQDPVTRRLRQRRFALVNTSGWAYVYQELPPRRRT